MPASSGEHSRRVLVLGGTTGIGQAVVQAIDDGWGDLVSIHAPSKDEVDVTREDTLWDYITEVEPTHVVYSAGVNYLDWIEDIHPEKFAEIMAVNLWGFVSTVQALMRTWRESDTMSIVAITSDAAYRPMRTSLAYCASKAALDMAIRCASRELAPRGWRINGVAPGKVADTPMTEYVDKRVMEVRDWTKTHAEKYEMDSTPIGRKVTKDEVAEVVLDVLFGPKALTGEIIAVNGGR